MTSSNHISITKYPIRMKSERQLDLKEKVKRIAFVQVSMTKISKSELNKLQIFCYFNATRLIPSLLLEISCRGIYTFYDVSLDLLRVDEVI